MCLIRKGVPIYSTKIGYVQLIDMQKLQDIAKTWYFNYLKCCSWNIDSIRYTSILCGDREQNYVIDEYYELRTAFTLGTCVILKKILDLDWSL
jgi:hypothetical protein